MSVPVRELVARDFAGLYPEATLLPMTGDASTRRFLRARLGDGSTRVLMDYGESFSAPSDDQRLTGIFLEAGLPVAAIEHCRADSGYLILEDLGEAMLEDRLQGSEGTGAESVQTLYREAVDLIVRMAVQGSTVLARSPRTDSPALDSGRFRFEMRFFEDHFLKKPNASLQSRLETLADLAATSMPQVLCHRDYHCRNLVIRPAGGLAMVDIQDARRGPEGYDLASLVFDPYADLDGTLRAELISRYLEKRADGIDSERFRSALPWIALQRLIKALGTFGYQATTHETTRYDRAIGPALRSIRSLATDLGDDGRLLLEDLAAAGVAFD